MAYVQIHVKLQSSCSKSSSIKNDVLTLIEESRQQCQHFREKRWNDKK